MRTGSGRVRVPSDDWRASQIPPSLARNACCEAVCNGPLMRIGSLFMFYCACWGSALLERLFPRLMRRFAFQTGLAILALRLVSLAFPCGALAQDAPPADSSTPVVAATAHDTDTLAQQTGAD